MLEASFTGLLRTVFIIIGVITVLRFIGRFIANKREQEILRNKEQDARDIEIAKKNMGKTTLHRGKKNDSKDKTDDIEFEEV